MFIRKVNFLHLCTISSLCSQEFCVSGQVPTAAAVMLYRPGSLQQQQQLRHTLPSHPIPSPPPSKCCSLVRPPPSRKIRCPHGQRARTTAAVFGRTHTHTNLIYTSFSNYCDLQCINLRVPTRQHLNSTDIQGFIVFFCYK